MAHKFRKGQKVVCVNDRYSNMSTMKKFNQWIVRDEIYTVRQHRPEGAEGGVLLEEIVNPPMYVKVFGGSLEPAFHPSRFVPLNEEEMENKEVIKEILETEEVLN
jgi:hypothetical protein